MLVTGGAGFIGSQLTMNLLERGSTLTVVDNPIAVSPEYGRLKLDYYFRLWRDAGYHVELNSDGIHVAGDHIVLAVVDLETEVARFRKLVEGHDVVFHLASIFGGRAFVDERQADCCRGFAINHNVIDGAHRAAVRHLHFSSSACVYPGSLNRPDHLLKEDDILSTGEGWASSDNSYGWVKLMGELELLSYHLQYGVESSVARYLTVYGPGEFDESHAIAALMRKACRKEDPYQVWGTGNQERGFTYVDDIVSGSIRACEVIRDATPVNLGCDKRYKIREVVDKILGISGHRPRKVIFDQSKPSGPYSRALDLQRSRQLLGWEPKVDLDEGLKATYEWLTSNIAAIVSIQRSRRQP